MKKFFIIKSVAITLLIIPVISFAYDWERITFDAPKNHEYTITMGGYFNKTGVVQPNGLIFLYNISNKKFPLDICNIVEYRFLGRTGDKTFEIEKISKAIASPKKRENINMYFDESNPSLLLFYEYLLDTGCTENDKIYLKMVNLKGNQLEYQIILPNCLRDK